MKTFEQLPQDLQMKAVDQAIKEIVSDVLVGVTPQCFQHFSEEIAEAHRQTMLAGLDNDIRYFDYLENMIRDRIENNQAMKLAMLHQAGTLAKSAYYPEKGDRTTYL